MTVAVETMAIEECAKVFNDNILCFITTAIATTTTTAAAAAAAAVTAARLLLLLLLLPPLLLLLQVLLSPVVSSVYGHDFALHKYFSYNYDASNEFRPVLWCTM